jgi:phosphate starvation-inducible protein PhoH
MFLPSTSFISNVRRPVFHNIVMRSSKKTILDLEFDSIIQNQSKYIPHYKPRGSNQQKYVRYLNNPDISLIIGCGPAGTGKTLFACATAVQELKYGNVNKIVLTRPVVNVEEDIGHLPGTIHNKTHTWTRPIFDIFEEFYSTKDIDAMIHSGIIEISPLAFMRGRTFKNAFIIADEMQNSSPNQMFMLTTRIGQGSRMVIIGDIKQSDRCEDNGLSHIIKLVQDSERTGDIRAVKLTNYDVERSKVVSNILKLYSHTPYGNNAEEDHGRFSVFSLNKK